MRIRKQHHALLARAAFISRPSMIRVRQSPLLNDSLIKCYIEWCSLTTKYIYVCLPHRMLDPVAEEVKERLDLFWRTRSESLEGPHRSDSGGVSHLSRHEDLLRG